MSGDNTKENSSKKGLIIIVIVFSIILIILIGVIVFLLGRNNANDSNVNNNDSARGETVNNREVTGSARVVLDEDSATDVMDEMRKEVEEGMFECNQNFTWTFDDGTAETRDAYVANSTNNKFPIYFDVYLNGTNELVYSSPVLPVGAKLTNFSLDKDLDPGEYQATVMYTLIRDEESQEVISTAGFVVTINVTN